VTGLGGLVSSTRKKGGDAMYVRTGLNAGAGIVFDPNG